MKAVVFHGIGDIRLDTVADPRIEAPTDAVVRLTSSAICGTDLHMVRGTLPGMVPGTVLGHEGVGVVEETGSAVSNLRKGDRVVIGSTIACGSCSYCRAGYYSQCDVANPNGPAAGTAFFGGPKETGPFNGLQAEYARIPYAAVGCVKLPENVSDDQAIPLSDIFTTGYFGADIAGIKRGHTVAVFGCGPVGQFAITGAFMLGAGRVIAIDAVPARLEIAAAQGAEIVNFRETDPVGALHELTNGIGVDCAIDAVGIDAVRRETAPDGQANWTPGDGPDQVLQWAVSALAKAGTLSIIGVYPQTMSSFPLGAMMNKNLTVRSGNCPHRRYLWDAVAWVKSGRLSPERVLQQVEPIADALEAYAAFDQRRPGWLKVELDPKGGAKRRQVQTARTVYSESTELSKRSQYS